MAKSNKRTTDTDRDQIATHLDAAIETHREATAAFEDARTVQANYKPTGNGSRAEGETRVRWQRLVAERAMHEAAASLEVARAAALRSGLGAPEEADPRAFGLDALQTEVGAVAARVVALEEEIRQLLASADAAVEVLATRRAEVEASDRTPRLGNVAPLPRRIVGVLVAHARGATPRELAIAAGLDVPRLFGLSDDEVTAAALAGRIIPSDRHRPTIDRLSHEIAQLEAAAGERAEREAEEARREAERAAAQRETEGHRQRADAADARRRAAEAADAQRRAAERAAAGRAALGGAQ